MSELLRETTKLSPDTLVTLFEIDARKYAPVGQLFRFVPTTSESDVIRFGGHTYTPFPCELTDMEYNGKGALPSPKFKLYSSPGISNVIRRCNDLIGCTFRRIRTFARFLDDAPDADPLAHFGTDLFLISRKSFHNPATHIEWELRTPFDYEGRQIPGRLAQKDYCPWIYRYYNGAWFEYGLEGETDVLQAIAKDDRVCPYAGTIYADAYGNPVTDASKDQCGKRLKDCQLRYGDKGPLPFGGFPGMLQLS